MKQKLPQQKDETNKDGNQEPQRAIKISRKNKRNRENRGKYRNKKNKQSKEKGTGKRQNTFNMQQTGRH